MNCPKCGQNISSSKFCPYCGAPADQATTNPSAPPSPEQPPTYQPQQFNTSPTAPAPSYQNQMQPPKKKGGCLKVGLIVLGVIVALGVIGSIFGGGGDNDSVSSVPPSNITSSTDPEDVPSENPEPKAPEKSSYSLNEAATCKNTEITVTAIEKSSGKQFDEPKDGMEYVIVTVQYRNVGDSRNISYNPYDFKLKNSKGQITDQTFTTVDTDTALSSGELAPGGEISGTISFEAPKDDPELILQYRDNVFNDSADIEFKLN